MSCDEFRGLLQDYVTRQLAPEKRREVDSHLLVCDGCQRELAILTAVVSSLDHQPVLEPPAEFASRVLGNLPRQRSFYPSPWWAIALGPILAGAAWLLRSPLTGALLRLGRLLGLQPDSLSQLRLPETVSIQQLVAVPLVVVGATMVLFIGALAYGWRFVATE